MTVSLSDVGVDVKTGAMDIDVIMTGKPRSLRDSFQRVIETVAGPRAEPSPPLSPSHAPAQQPSRSPSGTSRGGSEAFQSLSHQYPSHQSSRRHLHPTARRSLSVSRSSHPPPSPGRAGTREPSPQKS